MAADHSAGEGGRDKGRAHGAGAGVFSKVHALVETAEHDERRLGPAHFTHLGVVGFGTGCTRYAELAGQAHFDFEKVLQAAGIGFTGHHRKTGGREKILGHRAPQIPQGLERGVAFAFDKWLGIEVEQFTELAQKLRGAVQADWRLQIGALQRLAQHAAELTVHANVHIGLHQTRHICQVAGQGKDHVDFRANALHQTADFG